MEKTKFLALPLLSLIAINANSAVGFIEHKSQCEDADISVQVYEAALNGKVLVQDLKLRRQLQNSLRSAKAIQRGCKLNKHLEGFRDEYFSKIKKHP